MTSHYRFISTYRAEYGVQRICRVFAIRRQGSSEWLAAAPARQELQRAEDDLAAEIAAIHWSDARWLVRLLRGCCYMRDGMICAVP